MAGKVGKIRKLSLSLPILLLAVQFTAAAPRFPFPQDQKYAFGTKPIGANHNDVQAAYEIFVKNYYEESGTMARIKWDKPEQTVSEGIGYGMLIMVLMDNTANNTQGKFDKLWAYYKGFLNNNGVMHWKINGFSGAAEFNGATDGDIDAAFALALAYYQWNDPKYKAAATDLMGKIYTHEVSGSKILKPGDAFDNPKNPSYFVAAAIGFFAQIKFDNNDWASLKAPNYAHVKSSANATTGLVPDWSGDNGSPDGRGPNYTFDAARTPWRIGLAYLWYGDQEAKDIAGKMTQWIKTSTNGDPSQIGGGYQLSGAKVSTFNLPTYIGPFACGAMVDASHQDWLNASYRRLATFIDDDNYYNESLQLLSLLTLTGNFLNLASATPKTSFTITTGVSPANAGTVKITPAQPSYPLNAKVTIEAIPSGTNKFSSWGGDLKGTALSQSVSITADLNITAYFNAGDLDLVDDGEDGNHLTRLGTKWFTYTDEANKGTSLVTPKTSATNLFTMADGGANSSKKAAKITYTLAKGANPYNPFVGMGFPLNPAGDSTPVNITAASGLTFYFKGSSCDVRVETVNVTDFGYFFKRLPASADWTLVSLKWSDFAQAIWAKKADFDLTKATKVAWQTTDKGVSGETGDILVDDVHLPGYKITSSRLIQPRFQAGKSHGTPFMGNQAIFLAPGDESKRFPWDAYNLSGKRIPLKAPPQLSP